jgi:hypothetical protein
MTRSVASETAGENWFSVTTGGSGPAGSSPGHGPKGALVRLLPVAERAPCGGVARHLNKRELGVARPDDLRRK